MATGYTYPVSTGELTNFSDFALQCSRAFGVLMHMKDSPMDATIPEKIEANPYYKDKLDELTARRKELLNYSEAQIVQAISDDFDKAVENRKKMVEETDAMRATWICWPRWSHGCRQRLTTNL
jgi:alkylhydroperoxidase family enzyme